MNSSKVNEIIQSAEFIDFANERVADKIVLANLKNFSITIVPDDEHRGGNDGEVIIPMSRFNYIIKTFDDLLEQFVHDTMHEIVWKYWNRCPVNVDDLTEFEFDVFSDIWIQSYVFNTMPHLHYLHWDYISKYAEFMNSEYTEVEAIVNLYKHPACSNSDHLLTQAHEWVYKKNQTMDYHHFSKFIQRCEIALNDTKVKELISRYGDALTGNNNELN